MLDDETVLAITSELDEILRSPGPGAREQKRRFTRICWRVPVICQQGAESFSAQVADVGVGGVALEVDRALEPLSYLQVAREANDHGPIRVKVRWCRPQGEGHRVGAALADSQDNLARSWLKAVLVELGLAEASRDRRRHVRVACRLPVEVATSQGLQGGWLVDLGAGGCQVHVEGELPLGGLELRIGTDRFLGRVVWVSGPAAGVSFESLDEAQRQTLQELLRRGAHSQS